MKRTILFLVLLFSSMPLLFAQDGALDVTFNLTGKVTTSIGSGFDLAKSIAIQPDGKIVVAGSYNNGSNDDFAVIRYNTDGTLDSGFGSAGIVTTAVGSYNDAGYSVAIQSDGKLVVAGISSNGANNDIAVVRYNSDGTLDSGFGSGGKVITVIGPSDDVAYGIAIQADGKIVVAGSAYVGNSYDFALVRYNTAGTLDTGFGTGGIVTTDFGSPTESANSVVIQTDGKIVAAGYSGLNNDFAAARYNTDGTLDSGFGSGGKVTTAIGSGTDVGKSVALQSDGKIVVAGYAHIGSTDDFAVVRYNSGGTLDNTFDTDGIVTTQVGTSTDWGYGVAIQTDGKIVVAGFASMGYNNIAVVRYNTNGSLDNTFDTDGIVTTAMGLNGGDGTCVAIQSDGKIVVAGDSYNSGKDADFAVVRYTSSNTDQLGSICGIKFNDLNGNGIKDAGEPGLSNWIINLTYQQATGVVTKSDTTNIRGNFCFEGLNPGTYTVQEVQQNGWQQTAPASPGTYTITLTAGQVDDTLEFGNHFGSTSTDTCSADSLTLSTGWDYNTNSTYTATKPATNQDVFWTLIDAPTDNGVVNLNGPAWVIKKDTAWAVPVSGSQWISAFDIAGSNKANIDSTKHAYIFQKSICVSDTTDLTFNLNVMVDNRVKIKFVDANGNLIAMLGQLITTSTSNFTGPTNFQHTVTTVIPGTYYIRLELRNDNDSSPMGVDLQGVVKGEHAALISSLCCHPSGSSISGYKFNDINGNGVKDTGEPFLSGWVFTLTGNGVNQTSTTDINGNYLFTGLQPGTYTITETPQAGWVAGPTGSTQTVTVGTNQAINNINFGNVESPDICSQLKAEATKSSTGDCCWVLSLIQPSNLTGVSSIQILALAPNQFTSGTGLGANYQTWYTSGSNTFTPPNGIVPGGNLNNFYNMCLDFVTSPQKVVVNWLNDSNKSVCSDTLELNCEIPCASIFDDTVTCAGSHYNYSYKFVNNADYGVSNIEYTVQSPNSVTITPSTVTLSPAVSPGSTSGIQSINITGAVPGENVSIQAKFVGTDGCCWCYETLNMLIPSCNYVCDSLSVQVQGSAENCCYSISLTNNSHTVFSSVEFELLSGGMFSTFETTAVQGWGSSNIFPNNLVSLVKFPIAQGIGHGVYNSVLDMCVRQYSSPNQVIEVRWIKDGNVVCRDTLKFDCIPSSPQTDSCSQAIDGTLKCLPDGTVQYIFRVQNNSNIISTGFGIYPTTPGVSFSKTIFSGVSILPNQVSPLDTITISGFGSSNTVCFQTAIFTTVEPGENVYNYCCHSDTMCITLPDCEKNDCTPPPEGMKAWWPFDETSGSTSADLAGYNNVGTQINGPTPVPAKVQAGLKFNGKNYVEVPDQSELNFGTGDFSFDAWIQTEDLSEISMLVDKRTSSATSTRGYSFFLNKGTLGLQLADGTSTSYFSSVFVSDGRWHHIAVTVSRAEEKGIRFYLDGQFLAYDDPTHHMGFLDNKGNLRIAMQSFSEELPFKGILDEIELFNRVLKQEEILSIYNAGSSGKCKKFTDVTINEKLPEKMQLLQCYPNPFNPTTTIRYNIVSTSHVTLSVFDLLGREIRVLVNEQKSPGRYEVVFDASNLSSGMYFYTLRTENYIESRKMLLLK